MHSCLCTAWPTSPRTFLNLDMEDYKDLDLTVRCSPYLKPAGHARLQAESIVLQACSLPFSPQKWAHEQLVTHQGPHRQGANLSRQALDAEIHGWGLTVAPAARGTNLAHAEAGHGEAYQ